LKEGTYALQGEEFTIVKETQRGFEALLNTFYLGRGKDPKVAAIEEYLARQSERVAGIDELSVALTARKTALEEEKREREFNEKGIAFEPDADAPVGNTDLLELPKDEVTAEIKKFQELLDYWKGV
jgi:hypothetical protein